MNNWPSVELGAVALIDRRSVKPEAIRSGTFYLGLEHIKSGGEILGSQVVNNGELASSKYCFTDKHLLYGKLRPYLAKIALPEFSGICSTDILPILPGDSLNRKFLAYFLRQQPIVDYANSRTTGVNLPRLSPSELANLKIPLPPLTEQQRIARILDAADALRVKRRQTLSLLETFLQSVFLDLFGDPVLNPKGWEVVKIGEHTSKVGSGATPKGGKESYKTEGISLIRSLNVRDGEFKIKDLARIDDKQAAKLSNVKVKQNDILLNIAILNYL